MRSFFLPVFRSRQPPPVVPGLLRVTAGLTKNITLAACDANRHATTGIRYALPHADHQDAFAMMDFIAIGAKSACRKTRAKRPADRIRAGRNVPVYARRHATIQIRLVPWDAAIQNVNVNPDSFAINQPGIV